MQNIDTHWGPHTLSTNKPYQHHLQKNSQYVSFDMKEISALFNNYCVRAFKQLQLH